MAGTEIEAIDVEREGRWCQVLLMEASPAAVVVPGATPFVGVVSADLGPELPAILAALRPGLQEIVCCDSLTEPVVTGDRLAMRALEELGFGQDFVFTVPTLEGAVDHAVDTLLAPDHGGWEGRFVVVIGPAPVVERAGRHLRG
jgi:hypothetical protein